MLRSIAGAVVGEVIGRKKRPWGTWCRAGYYRHAHCHRSLPGALLVGGALVAKAVYDRRTGRLRTK